LGEQPFPPINSGQKREQAPRTPNAAAPMNRPEMSRSVWSAPGLPALWVQGLKARTVSGNSIAEPLLLEGGEGEEASIRFANLRFSRAFVSI